VLLLAAPRWQVANRLKPHFDGLYNILMEKESTSYLQKVKPMCMEDAEQRIAALLPKALAHNYISIACPVRELTLDDLRRLDDFCQVNFQVQNK
jgi:hypothetical protein